MRRRSAGRGGRRRFSVPGGRRTPGRTRTCRAGGQAGPRPGAAGPAGSGRRRAPRPGRARPAQRAMSDGLRVQDRLAPARPLAAVGNRCEMYVATSGAGSSRGVNRGPVGVFGVIRSTRKVRQSSRSRSQPTRYHRPPQVTRWCGSTLRGGSHSSSSAVRGARSRTAAPRGPGPRCRSRSAARCRPSYGAYRRTGRPSVTCSASTRCRSRAGITWRTVASARSAPSSIPVDRGGRGLQGDGDRDRLLVVEQQRRQVARPRRAGSRRPGPWSRARGSRGRAAGRRRGGPCAG